LYRNDIFSIEYCRNLESWVMGSFKVTENGPDRLPVVYHLSIAPSVNVFELMDVEEYRDLEIYVRGQFGR